MSNRNSRSYFFPWLIMPLLFFVLFPSSISGVSEWGIPFSRYYLPPEYEGSTQVWAIAQDKRGVLYFGSSDGEILEYDGVSWRHIPLPDTLDTVRSLDMDENGTIYVGAAKELGYLAPDNSGALVYVSLMKHLPASEQNFADVWDTHCTDKGIYFHTSNKLLRWHKNRFKTWDVDAEGGSHYLDGALYIAEKNGSLIRLENDSIERLYTRDEFKRGVLAMIPLPTPNDDVLIASWRGPLKPFNLKTGQFTDSFKVPGELNRFLVQNTLYRVLPFPDGRYALSTLNGGIVIVDSGFSILHILDKSKGMPEQPVFYALRDRQDGLWAATNNGIVRLEVDFPVTRFDETIGLKGTVTSVRRHNGVLYVSTFSGLYYLENGRFEKVEGIENICWDMVSFDDSRLLAAGIDGVFLVKKKKAVLIHDVINALCLHRPGGGGSRFYVGYGEGFAVLSHEIKNGADNWKLEYTWKSVPKKIWGIHEDHDGRIWLNTRTDEVFRVTVPPGGGPLSVTAYNASTGLPGRSNNAVATFDARTVLLTEKGFYIFDAAPDRFFPAPGLNDRFGLTSLKLSGFIPDHEGNYWVITEENKKTRLSLARPVRRGDGGGNISYKLDDSVFQRIASTSYNAIYPEPGGVTWFGGSDGIFRFDGGLRAQPSPPFNTLIREVTAGEKECLFKGSFYSEVDGQRRTIPGQPEELKPFIRYHDNTVRFHFAALNFDNEGANRYRYLLEGHDEHWSEWTPATEKEYSNLWEGTYTFRVQAKNVYGREGEEAAYTFVISAPWYRAYWAYAIYGLILIMIFYGGMRWYSFRLKRINQRLEQVVKERTEEISRQKEALETQAQELESANRAKSAFLARMSHEIRTPMNGVLGFTEMLLDTNLDEEQLEFANTIQRSGDVLISVINDILDLSKIEAGEFHLDPIDFDPEITVYDVCEMILPRLDSGKVELMCRIGDDVPAFVYGDVGRFRQVLLNLLGNAAKFTETGEIEVSLAVDENREPGDPRVKFHVMVRDTGIGIPYERQDSIFTPFRQADHSISRKYGGTGLGLPICKEIARLMGGDIGVESEPWKGSVFHFTTWMETSTKKEDPLFKREMLEGKTALVVDDNPVNLDILTHTLVHAGMKVKRLTRLEDVTPAVRGAFEAGVPVDIAIIDIRLGIDSGLDAARAIKALPPPMSEIPLLAFSSSLRTRAKCCKEAGFDGYLPKPVRRRRMLEMIEHLLDKKNRVDSEEPRVLATRHSIREKAKQSVHILLVEDNAINRKLAQQMLSRAGYRVTTANDGEDAVAVVTADPKGFDLVFMDIQMPRMDGRQAARILRNKGVKDLPIIAMTAESLEGDRRKCLEAGMNDYISKPINREKTFQIIKKYTDVFASAAASGGQNPF